MSKPFARRNSLFTDDFGDLAPLALLRKRLTCALFRHKRVVLSADGAAMLVVACERCDWSSSTVADAAKLTGEDFAVTAGLLDAHLDRQGF